MKALETLAGAGIAVLLLFTLLGGEPLLPRSMGRYVKMKMM